MKSTEILVRKYNHIALWLSLSTVVVRGRNETQAITVMAVAAAQGLNTPEQGLQRQCGSSLATRTSATVVAREAITINIGPCGSPRHSSRFTIRPQQGHSPAESRYYRRANTLCVEVGWNE